MLTRRITRAAQEARPAPAPAPRCSPRTYGLPVAPNEDEALRAVQAACAAISQTGDAATDALAVSLRAVRRRGALNCCEQPVIGATHRDPFGRQSAE